MKKEKVVEIDINDIVKALADVGIKITLGDKKNDKLVAVDDYGNKRILDKDFNIFEDEGSCIVPPEGCSFSKKFPAWIIAYCVDTNSWFCTNQRFFYYQYLKEFQCENDAIDYFEHHVDEFVELNIEIRKELNQPYNNCVFLENNAITYMKGLKKGEEKC